METEHLGKASYLTYKGHRVTIVGGRYIFDPSAQHDAEEYDAGALVPAAIFADCLLRLRRLTAEKRGAAR